MPFGSTCSLFHSTRRNAEGDEVYERVSGFYGSDDCGHPSLGWLGNRRPRGNFSGRLGSGLERFESVQVRRAVRPISFEAAERHLVAASGENGRSESTTAERPKSRYR